jgi:ABC-type sugar transport system substrate-binding protein
VLQAATEAQNAEIKKCTECESGVIEVSIEDFVGGKVPNLATAYLQQHPETEYMVASTGELTTGGLRAAMTSAGVGENTKIIGGFPLQANVEEIAKGNETAYFALAQQEAAWHVVDAMARLSVGDSLEGVQEQFTSTFLQNEENLGSEPKVFEGVPGYQEQFEALWAGK